MNEQQIRELFSKGFDNLKPHIKTMSNVMMECYMQGFKDCWKLFTGKDFDE